MTITERLKALSYWMTDKIRAAWSRFWEMGIETQDKALVKVIGFLTSPLSETEYALLKRVSGIMGTALAMYIILMAGIATALVVFGLCLVLAYALNQVSTQTLEEAQSLR
jgi:hypothetical protein